MTSCGNCGRPATREPGGCPRAARRRFDGTPPAFEFVSDVVDCYEARIARGPTATATAPVCGLEGGPDVAPEATTGPRTPTAAEFAALPERVRRYIHDVEARLDPAGDVRALGLLRDENEQLRAKIAELVSIL